MPEPASFEYAIVRVVPHIARGEFVNVGVILYCKRLRCLRARLDFDLARLQAFAPQLDIGFIQTNLHAIETLCVGQKIGPFAQWTLSERFNWLVAPSSTMIQMSPVHCGVSKEPQKTIEELYALFVG